MQASLDKRYSASELGACRTIPYPDQKVECMEAAGRGAPREPDAAVVFDNRSEATTVVKVFWRQAGGGAWSRVPDVKKLKPGRRRRVSFFSGAYDLCVETRSGASAVWRNVWVAGEHTVFFEQEEDDPEVFSDVGCREGR